MNNREVMWLAELTALNDQQEPHWPWSLTGVTAPCSRQSTFFGGVKKAGSMNAVVSLATSSSIPFTNRDLRNPFMVETNS